MRNAINCIIVILLVSSCKASQEQTICSPDKKFTISYVEEGGYWPYPRVSKWTDAFHFKSKGRWHSISSQGFSYEYYCDDADQREYYEDLKQEEDNYAEWDLGFKPMRIDQISLSDGTKVYLVYALTYSDTGYHEYYYSYTALCTRNGKIWRYPIFKGLMNCKEIQSDIIVIHPASIDLDFTLRPANYDFRLDCKIAEAWVENRIMIDPGTNELILADTMSFPFNGISFYLNQ